ncbi:MAG TPA: hypothetical protein VNF91_00115 [Candidatus Acidoferrum sp.]|nr:hypothetical protein [Candidatus Acidoferrum sp.]
MGLLTANGQEVLEAKSSRRRAGAWSFDLLVDHPEALVGQVTIVVNDGAMTFVGTATRTGVFSDTGHVRVIAGAGGLSTVATPRSYNGQTVSGVLSDLLADAGETLSATADAEVLGQELDAWTTAARPVADLLSLLLAAGLPGAIWRNLPDGTIWVGNETWPDAEIDSSLYQVFEDSAETNSMLVGCDAPFLLPGTTFEGRKVGYVEDSVGQEGHGVTTRILFEDATAITDIDRVRKSLFRLAARAASRTDVVDYSRRYPAQIISQSGNTVDVQPDEVNGKALLDSMGSVPLWLGVPGASVEGIAGGRCLIGWKGGDPSQPYAMLFDGSETPETVTLSVAAQLLLGGSAAPPAIVGAPYRAAEDALFAAIGAAATAALAVPAVDPGAIAFLNSIVGLMTGWATTSGGAQGFLSTKVGISP